MLTIDIPGHDTLHLEHLVLDYNGTFAVDGEPVPGAIERLEALSAHLQIHVVTADTFGKVRDRLRDARFITVSVLPPGRQTRAKRQYVEGLGREKTACIGNGRNDREMLDSAALGIAVVLEEGCAVETLQAADIVCRDITHALDLLANPMRLAATLRS